MKNILPQKFNKCVHISYADGTLPDTNWGGKPWTAYVANQKLYPGNGELLWQTEAGEIDASEEAIGLLLKNASNVVGNKLAEIKGGTLSSAFISVFSDGLNLDWDEKCTGCRAQDINERCGNNFSGDCRASGAYTASKSHIIFASTWSQYNLKVNHIIHEFGHAFDNYFLNTNSDRSTFRSIDARVSQAMMEGLIPSSRQKGFADASFGNWQQSPNPSGPEQFADMFLGWSYGRWASDDFGKQRRGFMNDLMIDFVGQ